MGSWEGRGRFSLLERGLERCQGTGFPDWEEPYSSLEKDSKKIVEVAGVRRKTPRGDLLGLSQKPGNGHWSCYRLGFFP